jgi:hypothetical protein
MQIRQIFILLIVSLSLVSTQNLNNKDRIIEEFQKFMKVNRVSFSNQDEYNRLFTVYQENYNRVMMPDSSTYSMELNKFSLLTKGEFKDMYLTLDAEEVNLQFDWPANFPYRPQPRPTPQPQPQPQPRPAPQPAPQPQPRPAPQPAPQPQPKPTPQPAPQPQPQPSNQNPTNFDWRSKNGVTPVKDQKQCGSCWAFTTVAMLESAYAIKYGQSVQFSEQQLVDCSSKDNGCNGGNMSNALGYIQGAGGIVRQSAYGYRASKGQCTFQSNQVAAKVSKYWQVAGNEEEMKKALVTYGPLGVAVDSTDMQFYSNGIYTCKGNVSINHGVTIVGYGEDGNGKYWIIKNSWGSSWGMNGYFYLRRGTNECGVTSYVMAAQVA